MNAGVARTDDARKIHPFDVFHSEVMIKGYIDVGVQDLLRTRSSTSLDTKPGGSENMTPRRRQWHRAAPVRLPSSPEASVHRAFVISYRGGPHHDDT